MNTESGFGSTTPSQSKFRSTAPSQSKFRPPTSSPSRFGTSTGTSSGAFNSSSTELTSAFETSRSRFEGITSTKQISKGKQMVSSKKITKQTRKDPSIVNSYKKTFSQTKPESTAGKKYF